MNETTKTVTSIVLSSNDNETKTETKREKTVRLISGNVNKCLDSLDMIEKRLNNQYEWNFDDYSNIEFALLQALDKIQIAHEKLMKNDNVKVQKARFTL